MKFTSGQQVTCTKERNPKNKDFHKDLEKILGPCDTPPSLQVVTGKTYTVNKPQTLKHKGVNYISLVGHNKELFAENRFTTISENAN